mgnify:CR=1 FL=1
MKWYCLNCLSGQESKAKLALEGMIKDHHLEEEFEEIVVPDGTVMDAAGVKSKKKFLTGYILVKMKLTDRLQQLVKATPKITSFVGDKVNPRAISQEDIDKMLKMTSLQIKPKFVGSFLEGQVVKIIDGPLINLIGSVEAFVPGKDRVKVKVGIFGRDTIVDLSTQQIQ